MNETEKDGVTSFISNVGIQPSKGSTLVCKICKIPPSCVASCEAKIYYVLAKDDMTCACVHFSIHNHPVKIGDYHDDIAKGESLVKEQVQRTPTVTNSTIVLEATKEMLGDMLLAPNGGN